ncbi:MAG: winged helix-turn-helix domain-containing protein [Xanthobacteraceae bacterium]
MTVPDYQSFLRPLLAFGEDGQEKNIKDAIAALADQHPLSEEDRQALLPSGKQTLLSNRKISSSPATPDDTIEVASEAIMAA